MIHDTFLYPFVPLVPFLVLFLFRKRLITAFMGFLMRNAVGTLDAMLFEEQTVQVDGKNVKEKVLTSYAKGFLAQAAPIMVSEGMKAIKLKVPQNLPINAQGQLDFMAPVLQKLASGKKVKIEDFLPVIMEKAMPYVEGFLGNMAGGAAKQPGAPDVKNPFLRDVGK